MPPISVFLRTGAAASSGEALLKEAAQQVGTHMCRVGACTSTTSVLADYFLRIEPRVRGEPFGVALAHSTFLYHMRLSRPTPLDLGVINALIVATLVRIPAQQRGSHPFVHRVVRERILGLPPAAARTAHGAAAAPTTPLATRECDAHYVALLEPTLFASFSQLAVALCRSRLIDPLMVDWRACLRTFAEHAAAPLVQLRSYQLLVRTADEGEEEGEEGVENLRELQAVLSAAPEALPVEALHLLFARLRLSVSEDCGDRTVAENALCVAASRIFLELPSPMRRAYVEEYLYPALVDGRLEALLSETQTMTHLGTQLMRLLVPNNAKCPYYRCAFALFSRIYTTSHMDGAALLVTLSHMMTPEAAHFAATMAVDEHVQGDYFAGVVLHIAHALDYVARGDERRIAGHRAAVVLSAGGAPDFVKAVYMLRALVLAVSAAAADSRRAGLVAVLREAMPMDALRTLGDYIERDPELRALPQLDPAILVLEIAMHLHGEHVDETVETVVGYLRGVLEDCSACGALAGAVCHDGCPTGRCQVQTVMSMNRLVVALSDAMCSRSDVCDRIEARLRAAPFDTAMHALLFMTMVRCSPSYRQMLFDRVVPLLTADVIPAVLRRVSTGAVNATSRRRQRSDAGNDEGAASAVALLTFILSLSRSPATFAPLAQRIAGDLLDMALHVSSAPPTATAATSDVTHRHNHIAVALWWSALTLLRFGGEPSTLAATCRTGLAGPGGVITTGPVASASLFGVLRHIHRRFPKLTGLSFSRLAVDFSVHTPVFVNELLSSGAPSLEAIGFDFHGSSFGEWCGRQILQSVPVRSALLIGCAQSIAMSTQADLAQGSSMSHRVQYGASMMMRLPIGAFMLRVLDAYAGCADAAVAAAATWLRGKSTHGAAAPGQYVMIAMTLAALLQCRHLSHRVADGGEAALRNAAPRLQALSHGLRYSAPPLARLAARLGNRALHGPHVEADAVSVASSEADADSRRQAQQQHQQQHQRPPSTSAEGFSHPTGGDSFADGAAAVGVDHDGPDDHGDYDEDAHDGALAHQHVQHHHLPQNGGGGAVSDFKPPLPPRATGTLDASRGLFSAVSSSSEPSSAASFVHQSRPAATAAAATRLPPPPGVSAAEAAAAASAGEQEAFDFNGWWRMVDAQSTESSIFDLNVIIQGCGTAAGVPGAADNIIVPPVAGGPAVSGWAPQLLSRRAADAGISDAAAGRGFGSHVDPNKPTVRAGPRGSTLKALAAGSLQDLHELIAMPPENNPRTSLSFI